MQSTYRSNLKEQLLKDRRKLEAFQRLINRTPLTIPVKLDVAGAKTQAAEIRKVVLGELSKTGGGAGIVGLDGRPMVAAARELNKAAGVLSTTELFKPGNNSELADTITQVRQLGQGLTEIRKQVRDEKSGELLDPQVIRKDIGNVAELNRQLKQAKANQGELLAGAKGRGDKQGQIAALRAEEAEINRILDQARDGGLVGTRSFEKGEDRLTGIRDKISGLEGAKVTAAEKKERAELTRAVANGITQEERRLQEALKLNKLAVEQAERIDDVATREAEVNRLYRERKQIFTDARDEFRELDREAQANDRPDLADRGMRRALGMENQANQVDLDAARRETDVLRKAKAEAEKAQKLADKALQRRGKLGFGRGLDLESDSVKLALRKNQAEEAYAGGLADRAARESALNRVLSERLKIYEESRDRINRLVASERAAGREDNAIKAERQAAAMQDAANRVQVAKQQLSTASIKAGAGESAAKTKQDYRRDLMDREADLGREIALNKAEERLNKSMAATKEDRAAISQKAAQDRARARGRAVGDFAKIESRAQADGFGDLALQARGAAGRAEKANAAEVDKLTRAQTVGAAASKKAAHALDFHSSSLLRNTATFTQWYAASQLALGVINAFAAGVSNSIRVERQFATLQAVFRGTSEEAQRLKEDTLELAVANGRSSEEALDSAIRWSRLGLTRVQVNRAVETSLIAANVAEIKASEAAEKLSAIYATYSLSVEDLPVVLNRLNAISNRYNVTNKDLLEGIVRVAGVAKQAGLELRDLEGIIGAVTGATGRPGQEVGNALKFVITRITDPKTVEKLKDQFDLDLTQPNGDLKDFADILAQLAAEFPKLNTAEKQQFLALTAGSRQAARFALILDQYRQSQILAAEAAFDSASAYKENEKIVASLASRIEGLKSAWTDLFTAIGDAGAFERAGAFLKFLRGQVDGLSEGLENVPKEKQDVKLSDPRLAELVESSGGGKDLAFGTRDSFANEELDVTLAKLRKFYAERDSLSQKVADGLNGGKPIFENGFDPVSFRSYDEVLETIQRLEALKGTSGASDVEQSIRGMTTRVNELRERLSGLGKSREVFTTLADEIEAGSSSRDKMLRDFQNGAHLLLNLEDGAQRYGQSIADFSKMLEAGDTAGAAELAREIAGLFEANVAPTESSFTEAQGKAVDALRKQMAELYAEKQRLLAQPEATTKEAVEEQAQAYETVEAKIKATSSAIDSLTKAAQEFEEQAFSGQAVDRIGDYLDAVRLLADEMSKFVEAGGSDEDPVARIFQRRRRAIGMPVELLQNELRATEAEAERRRANFPVEATGDKARDEAVMREARQQDAAVQMIKTRVNLAEKEVEKKLLLIDAEERLAELARLRTEAGRAAVDTAASSLIGRNDTEKLLNQTDFVLSRAQQNLIKAGDPFGRSATPAEKNAEAGAIFADEATAQENILALERKRYDLVAERANLELTSIDEQEKRFEDFNRSVERMEEDNQIQAARDDEDLIVQRGRREEGFLLQRRRLEEDILEFARKQNEEASKRLQMASREDQLRAAALSRTIRDKGAIGENEFYSLSQNTRQAIVNYLPDQAPGDLNPTREERRNRLRDQRRNERNTREDDDIRDDYTREDRGRSLDRRAEDAERDFNRGEEDAQRDVDRKSRELNEQVLAITQSLEPLKLAFSDVANAITRESGKGGGLDVVPEGPGRPAQEVGETRDRAPTITLDVGNIDIRIQVADQMEAIFRRLVDERFDNMEASIRNIPKRRASPNAQGATE